MADATRFWFNTETGEVEEGRVSDWSVVLGPYPTRDAAAHALDTARARSSTWDREDREWEEGRREATAHDEAARPSSGNERDTPRE